MHTASCIPTCLVRRWSYKRTQQLPSCHGYAGVGGVFPAQYPPNFTLVGACVPGARRTRRSCLCPPEGYRRETRRASPVTGGSGGKPPRNTAAGKVFLEGGPRRRFGYFAAAGKVTPVSPRPAGRDLSQNKKALAAVDSQGFLLNPNRTRTSKSVPFRRGWCTHTPFRRP